MRYRTRHLTCTRSVPSVGADDDEKVVRRSSALHASVVTRTPGPERFGWSLTCVHGAIARAMNQTAPVSCIPAGKMSKAKKVLDEAREIQNPELDLADKGIVTFEEMPGLRESHPHPCARTSLRVHRQIRQLVAAGLVSVGRSAQRPSMRTTWACRQRARSRLNLTLCVSRIM